MALLETFIVFVRAAVEDGVTDREFWAALIRVAQSMEDEESSYQACKGLVETVAARPEMARLVREIALEWYEPDALRGAPEAGELLYNYAIMACDQELLGRFSFETPPAREEPPPKPAAEVLAHFGLTESTVGESFWLSVPVRRYRR